MNKAKLIVTRVFDSDRTPQDAFVRAILNSDKYEKNLQVSGGESIIKDGGLITFNRIRTKKGETDEQDNIQRYTKSRVIYPFIG